MLGDVEAIKISGTQKCKLLTNLIPTKFQVKLQVESEVG